MQRLGSRLPAPTSPLLFGDVIIGESVDKDGTLTIFGGKGGNKALTIKDGTNEFLTINPDNTIATGKHIHIVATPEASSDALIVEIEAKGSNWAANSGCLKIISNDADCYPLRIFAGSTEKASLNWAGGLSLAGNITLTSGGSIASSANGNITILPNGTGITIVGDAGTTSHSLATNDDLFVTGELEIDGDAHFDAEVDFNGATLTGSTVTHDAYVTLSVGGVAKKFMLGS